LISAYEKTKELAKEEQKIENLNKMLEKKKQQVENSNQKLKKETPKKVNTQKRIKSIPSNESKAEIEEIKKKLASKYGFEFVKI